MNGFYLISILVPVSSLRKILRSESSDSSAEILNSSVRSLDEFTICGRMFSHHFSSQAQTLLHIPSEQWKPYVIGLGTFPGFPCDEIYYEGTICSVNPPLNFFCRLYRLYEK